MGAGDDQYPNPSNTLICSHYIALSDAGRVHLLEAKRVCGPCRSGQRRYAQGRATPTSFPCCSLSVRVAAHRSAALPEPHPIDAARLTITSATSVPAGAFNLPGGRGGASVTVPAFCRVAGVVKPEVNFEVWLPADWNRKFLMVGNGGLAGTISFSAMVAPLQRGYATASTDTGHAADNDGHWAQGHMERVIDFAHRGVHVTTEAGKAIVQRVLRRGRRACLLQRMLARRPGSAHRGAALPRGLRRHHRGRPGQLLDASVYGRAYVDHAGVAERAARLHSRRKTQLIGDAVNAACDALDGIKDGILNDPRRCHFDPSLALQERRRAELPHRARRSRRSRRSIRAREPPTGEQIFPGILPGSEAGQGGWASWITGTAPGGATYNARHAVLELRRVRGSQLGFPHFPLRPDPGLR